MRYKPVPIKGTCGADHLAYEVTELLQESYASAAAAEKGWYRACNRANRMRQREGLGTVGRPMCAIVEVP